MILFWLSYITFFYLTSLLVAKAEIHTKISLVFWSIRWHQKDIWKLTDLYYSIFRIADFNRSGIHYTYLLFRSGFLKSRPKEKQKVRIFRMAICKNGILLHVNMLELIYVTKTRRLPTKMNELTVWTSTNAAGRVAGQPRTPWQPLHHLLNWFLLKFPNFQPNLI